MIRNPFRNQKKKNCIESSWVYILHETIHTKYEILGLSRFYILFKTFFLRMKIGTCFPSSPNRLQNLSFWPTMDRHQIIPYTTVSTIPPVSTRYFKIKFQDTSFIHSFNDKFSIQKSNSLSQNYKIIGPRLQIQTKTSILHLRTAVLSFDPI